MDEYKRYHPNTCFHRLAIPAVAFCLHPSTRLCPIAFVPPKSQAELSKKESVCKNSTVARAHQMMRRSLHHSARAVQKDGTRRERNLKPHGGSGGGRWRCYYSCSRWVCSWRQPQLQTALQAPPCTAFEGSLTH
jgi:hypothetical protein